MCALALSRSEADVVVVDRGIREQRCSYGNAGSVSAGSVAPFGMPGVLSQVPGWLFNPNGPLFVRPAYFFKALPWLMQFIRASTPARVEAASHALKELLGSAIDLYLQVLREVGSPDLMQRTGQLQLYPSKTAYTKDAGSWQLRRDRGVSVEIVTDDEIRQLEPAVARSYRYGVFLPNEGMIVDPGRLVDALAEHLARQGVEFVTADVRGFESKDGVPCGLVTDRGVVHADHIVVAAGAWSNNLSQQAGDDVPLQTQRGYHVHLTNPGVRLNRPIVAADRKFFVTPMGGDLRVAGTVEFDGLDVAPNYSRADALAKQLPHILPEARVADGKEWMGNRPCLPDSLPVIDRSRRLANVFYGFGGGHLGLTGAPMVGRLVADLVLGREPAIDIRPFSVRRFF